MGISRTNLIYAWRTAVFFSVSHHSPSPFFHSLQTFRSNMVRRSRSQKIRLFCSLCFKLQAAGKNLLIHYQRKIVELSRQGVRKVSQMRRHLEADVKTAGIGGHQLALNEARRRFQPTNLQSHVSSKNGPTVFQT